MIKRENSNGAAILIFITLVLLATTTILVSQLSVNQTKNQRTSDSAGSLGTAKQALIGFALAHAVPGTLPCPDNTGDGLENPAGANCQSQLGLFPYRTLNVPELTDGAGSPLWYAVSLNYTNNAPANKNSSIVAGVQLDGSAAAAVIIAPGPPLDAQNRRQLVVTDFLEGTNADGDQSTYSNAANLSNNDQVLSLEPSTYWSIIEHRVTREATRLLSNYRVQCGEYPWAANFGGPYNSVAVQQSGAMPLSLALPFNWGGLCGINVAPTPPAWLVSEWSDQLYYAMCLSIQGSCLTITGAGSASSVVVAPGVPFATQARPDNDPTDYFEEDNVNLPQTQYKQATLLEHSGTYNDISATLEP